MKQKRLIVLISVCLLLVSPKGKAQDDTSHRAVNLPEVSIQDKNTPPDVKFVQNPTQVVVAKDHPQLSDAVRTMSGITLKDYGGIGGIKTVSVRGLGSQFSTLTIDGVAVSDCQNGQVDLGRYSLGNSAYVTMANGQHSNTLQSARALAAGSIINMETRLPEFDILPLNLELRAEGGSFGYLAPTLNYEQRLGRKASITFFGNYTRCNGDYPFTLYYTASHADSTSLERRRNSQMWLGTADINFFYQIDHRSLLHVKSHFMSGYHALPGPVIFYSAKASEHSEEQLFFTQARYKRQGNHWDMQLLGKYQISNDIYEDTSARTPTGVLHNEYQQREGYLSQAVRFHSGTTHNDDQLTLSFSADEALSQLLSNLNQHNEVQRFAALGVLAAKYRPQNIEWLNGLDLDAHLLGTFIRDYEASLTSKPYTRLSPYAGILWTRNVLTLRYFFKETYRVPNFNELYYFTVGRSLQPEKALQNNLGVSYHGHSFALNETLQAHLNATADLYYNRVSDKIIAIPTQNMFLWSMTNLGQVEIIGLDIRGEGSLYNTLPKHFNLRLCVGYSFQRAVDCTDPASKTYGHQIPYTPRHSGNIALSATTPWVDIDYTVMLVGGRYSMQQNTPTNRLNGYVDQNLSLGRAFDLKHCTLELKAQVFNIFDVQYEVVRNYPMMGRNYRISLTCKL